MQSFKKNWLVVSNMTWGIWWIFTKPLKSPKVTRAKRAKNLNISEELCVMALKGDAKFKWKLNFDLKNDISNLVNFRVSSYMVLFHDNEEWWKVWRKTLGSKNDMKNLVNFNASSGKSENVHFVVLLLSIAYKVSIKKAYT